MRPIPFLAAILVIVSLTMPWLAPSEVPSIVRLPSNSTSYISLQAIAERLYENSTAIGEEFNGNIEMDDVFQKIFFVIGIVLIVFGAVVGLFAGKFGHGVGLLGMVLFTASIVYTAGTYALSVGVGYLLAWIGFSIGFISSVSK